MNNNDYENKDIDVNDTEEGMTANDVHNDSDIEKGEEQDAQVCEAQEQADVKEEKADEEQGQDLGEKEEDITEQTEDAGKEATDNISEGKSSAGQSVADTVNTAPRYSSSFAPPYRSADVSGRQSGGYSYGVYNNYAPVTSAITQKKNKKKYGAGVVVALSILCVFLTMCMFAMMATLFLGADKIINNGGNETLNVLQGTKDITIIENNSENKDLSVVEVVALVGESVVEITTTHVQTNGFYGQYITSGAGSGVFFSQTDRYGYIVTNYHVISGAEDIAVRVKSGDKHTEYVAEYVGGDEAEDIAVIRITPKSNETFTVAVFRNYEKSPLQVGEEVIAIGNPLGQLGGTVTNGILSALDRQITVENNTMVLLQTNAEINPGNSGGGLFDTAGNLIGIVNAKQSSEGIEGLGFAIPANRVLEVIDDILNLGYVSGRPTFGVAVQYGKYGTSYWNQQTGVFVVDAGNTEFEKYDRIIAINGTEITTLAQYNAILKSLTIGEKAEVTVVRSNKEVRLSVTVLENTAKS